MYFFYVIITFFIAFLLEGYILSPKIIGEKLGLHPLAILYAVFLFGALFFFQFHYLRYTQFKVIVI